jgi:hypothetical protein
VAGPDATARGKTRTREHVLADLSINYVERHVLLSGHSVMRVQPDYGYDLVMFTHNAFGEVEAGHVYFQVKATDRLPLLKDGTTVSWPVSRRDLRLWLEEPLPVILVVYDGRRDRASWVHLQDYFSGSQAADLFPAGEWVSVRIPGSSRLGRQAIQKVARQKRLMHQQLLRKEGPHA